MRKYSDYYLKHKKKRKKADSELTHEEWKNVEWTKYKIVVPTETDKQEVMDALEHFHNSMFDSDIIAANQLSHEYLTPERETGSKNNIIVDPELYEQIKDK